MYRAKQNGRGRYVFFEEQMNIEALERVALERDLRCALDRDELVMHFTAGRSAHGRRGGAEMLVRWNHPTRACSGPTVHLSGGADRPNREHRSASAARACAQYSRWRADGIALERLAVKPQAGSSDRSISGSRARLAGRRQHVASSLELESRRACCLRILPKSWLTSVGFRHGRAPGDRRLRHGYSSLSYLKRLPIHAVKIDASSSRRAASD